jgi:hypothetical protein
MRSETNLAVFDDDRVIWAWKRLFRDLGYRVPVTASDFSSALDVISVLPLSVNIAIIGDVPLSKSDKENIFPDEDLPHALSIQRNTASVAAALRKHPGQVTTVGISTGLVTDADFNVLRTDISTLLTLLSKLSSI